MGNPYPVHTCTVGPFDSYYSNVVNRLNRITSNNQDCNLSSDKIHITPTGIVVTCRDDGSYHNCVPTDIGKIVWKLWDVWVEVGPLVAYDNTLKKWWISATALITPLSPMKLLPAGLPQQGVCIASSYYYGNGSQITLSAGSVIKDDVLIRIDGITIDFSDEDYYHYKTVPIIWTVPGYYYILLEYTYEKARPAPKPRIQILKPNQRTAYAPGGLWVLLKVVKVELVGGSLTITELYDYDPESGSPPSIRRIFSSPYLGLEYDLPVFNFLRDNGRLIETLNDETLYYGGTSGWQRIASIAWIDNGFVDLESEIENLRTFVGSTGPTDTDPPYTSTKIIDLTDNLTTAVSKLDNSTAFRSEAIPPSKTFAYQTYIDTSASPDPIVYIRNAANTAWVRWGRINKDPDVDVVDRLIPDSAAGFEKGTKTVFYQDAAPIGWTILNTLDDKLLYITKGSVAGGRPGGAEYVGGSWTISGFSTNIEGHALSTAELPPHEHAYTASQYAHSIEDGDDHHHTVILNSPSTYYTDGGYGLAGLPHTHPTGGSFFTPGWRPAAYCAIICEKS
jgi:hypothetical protein